MLITHTSTVLWAPAPRILADDGFQPDMVTTTIVAGKVLMQERRPTKPDEPEDSARAGRLAKKAWKCYVEQFRA